MAEFSNRLAGSVGIPSSTMFPPPEAPYDAFPYLFSIYLVATCGWFILQRLRSPELVGSMEQGIDAIHAKFEAENAIYGGVRLNTVSLDNNGFD